MNSGLASKLTLRFIRDGIIFDKIRVAIGPKSELDIEISFIYSRCRDIPSRIIPKLLSLI